MGIILLIVFVLLLGIVGKRLGLAIVVGQLLSGIILGPAGLDWLSYTHLIALGSEIGVLLLMFSAGLETDWRMLLKNWRIASLVAVLGVVFPFIMFTAFSLCLGYLPTEAIFWGIVFAATSISITLSVLGEQQLLISQLGAVILGAAVLDDVIALLMMGGFTAVAGEGDLEWTSLLPLIVFFVGIVLGRLAWGTHLLKGSNIIGNYILYPLFFGSIGLRVTMSGLSRGWLIIIVLIILAVISKMLGAGLGAKLGGADYQFSLAVGAGMVSRGEMALIIASLGFSTEVISAVTFSEMIIVTIVSTILAPIIMRPIFKRISKKLNTVSTIQ